MKTMPIYQRLAHTTIDTQAVKQYLHEDPGYLQACSIVKGDAHMRTVANHADYVEYHLRHYLTGSAKTMHRLLYELRAFVAFDKPMAQTMILLIFSQNQAMLVQNEWYEFMPRFDYARRQIKRQFLI